MPPTTAVSSQWKIQVQNSPNPGWQLLTVNVIVGLTVIPDYRYGSIVQEYGPVDDHMHPTSGSRASSQISFWGEIAENRLPGSQAGGL